MASEQNNNLRDEVIEMRVEMRQMRSTMEKVAAAIERLSAIEARASQRDEQVTDHETRIRSLEKGWWKAIGAAGAVSAAISLGIVKLGALL